MTARYHELVAPERCWYCREFPCECEARMREKPCACGGTVRADPANPYLGVRLHQEQARHRLYRARFELR